MDRLPTQSGGGTFRPPPYIVARHCITEFKPRSSVRERRSGGRILRAQKIVKRCPSCKTDISDFLADPQINRDMMDVIESLQLKVQEGNTTKERFYMVVVSGDTAEEFHDGHQEEYDDGGMEMDDAGCSFNVEEGESNADHKDIPADMMMLVTKLWLESKRKASSSRAKCLSIKTKRPRSIYSTE